MAIIAFTLLSEILPEAFVAIDTACSGMIDIWVKKNLQPDEDQINQWHPRDQERAKWLIRNTIKGACHVHNVRQYFLTDTGKSRPYMIVGAHHKTGSTLARKLFARICSELALECSVHTSQSKLEDILSDSLHGRAITFHGNWKRWLPQNISRHSEDFRFIHFVREPCSMISSGYKYHMGGKETWTLEHPSNLKKMCNTRTAAEYCSKGKNEGENKIIHITPQECPVFEAAMLEESKGYTSYPEPLREIYCNASSKLEEMGMDPDKIKYADALVALPRRLGLALEAATMFYIINSMLHVTENTMNDRRTYTVKFEDIMNNFENTLTDILDFLEMPARLLPALKTYNTKESHRLYDIYMSYFKSGHKVKDHKRTDLVEICRTLPEIQKLYRT